MGSPVYIVAQRDDGLNMSTCLFSRQTEYRTNRTCLIFLIMHPWRDTNVQLQLSSTLIWVYFINKTVFSFDGIFPNPDACVENYHFEFSLLPSLFV